MSFSDYGFHREVDLATPDCMPGCLNRMEKERTSNVNTFDNLCSTLTLGDIIHQPHGLIGRGSLVVDVKPDNDLPEGWSQRRLLSSREPEHEILEEIKGAIVRDSSAAWVENHLPNAHSQMYSALDGIVPFPTGMVGGSDEDWGLNLLTMERLDCIDTIQDCAELVTAFEQIVRCHRWVYEEARILHRDISVKNFMFRRGKDDRIQGVLNDFDLATPVRELDKGPTSKQRTGTWPYLAIELLNPSTWLQPPRHLYRYDLESFFWVLLTLAVDPAKPNVHNILQWSACSHAELYRYKSTFLFQAGIDTTPLHPQYKALKEYLTSCSETFFSVHTRLRGRSSDVIDTDSVGGLITGETFLQILESHQI